MMAGRLVKKKFRQGKIQTPNGIRVISSDSCVLVSVSFSSIPPLPSSAPSISFLQQHPACPSLTNDLMRSHVAGLNGSHMLCGTCRRRIEPYLDLLQLRKSATVMIHDTGLLSWRGEKGRPRAIPGDIWRTSHISKSTQTTLRSRISSGMGCKLDYSR